MHVLITQAQSRLKAIAGKRPCTLTTAAPRCKFYNVAVKSPACALGQGWTPTVWISSQVQVSVSSRHKSFVVNTLLHKTQSLCQETTPNLQDIGWKIGAGRSGGVLTDLHHDWILHHPSTPPQKSFAHSATCGLQRNCMTIHVHPTL